MKLLGIFAHPDDEIIFGWPVLQNDNIHKKIITAVGGSNRIAALNRSAEILCFESSCLGAEDGRVSDFMDELEKIITKTVDKYEPDVIFTHNPHGEYGHPDHLSIFNSVYRNPNVKNLLITDISCNVKSRKFRFPKIEQNIPHEEFKKFYINKICRCTKNIKLFDEIKKVYKQHDAWTWPNSDKISNCCLYFAKSEHFHRKKILNILQQKVIS